MDKHTTPRLTRAYSPREIRDTQRFLFQVRLKRRLLYCLKIVNYLLLLAVGLLFVYPFAWMASMSLRPLIEALSFAPGLWVSDPQWSNYLYAWNQARIFHYVGNSIKYSVLVMGLQYFTLIPAAFAFATMKFRGKKLLWGAKFLGMMLPAEATFIPVYYFYSKLGLVDNWIGLILPSLVAMFGIFMFKNAFEAIPAEVLEAARMDKAKNRTIMLGATNIPLLNADIVTGISMMLLFVKFMNLGFVTVLIAHITFDVPYVILNVLPKLNQTNRYTYEAALDLGATPMYAFYKVT